MFARIFTVVLFAATVAACGDDVTTNADAAAGNLDAAVVMNRDAAPVVNRDAAPVVSDDAAPAGNNDAAAVVNNDAAPVVNDDAAVVAPPDAGGPADGGAPAMAFSVVYTQVIQPNCSCHTLGSSGGLGMATEQAAYNNLVGIPAAGCPGVTRVTPGSPVLSHLSLKLAGTQTCGSQMPLGGNPLAPALQAIVNDWITAGAQR